MNQFKSFIDRYVTWGAGALGVLLALYCVVLQSVWFTYVNFFLCFAAVLIGAISGYALITYLKGVSQKSKDQAEAVQKTMSNQGVRVRVITSQAFRNTMRGSLFLLLVSALLGFLSSEIVWFLVGVFGMMASSVALITFKIWEIQERK